MGMCTCGHIQAVHRRWEGHDGTVFLCEYSTCGCLDYRAATCGEGEK